MSNINRANVRQTGSIAEVINTVKKSNIPGGGNRYFGSGYATSRGSVILDVSEYREIAIYFDHNTSVNMNSAFPKLNAYDDNGNRVVSKSIDGFPEGIPEESQVYITKIDDEILTVPLVGIELNIWWEDTVEEEITVTFIGVR